MKDSTKNKIVTIAFFLFLYVIFFINVLKQPTEVSTSERRKLAQFPKLSIEMLSSTKFMENFSSYAVDQFVGRDTFRKIKARFLFQVLQQKDNHGIYIADGHASKTLTDLKEGEIKQAIKNLNRFYQREFQNCKVYYGIIPDKNYFLAEKNGYPHIDYEKFEAIVTENMDAQMKYIDLWNTVKLEDYYTTDIHWKQERLGDVTNQILKEMTRENDTFFENQNYEKKEMNPFYGNYYGQSALPLESETLVLLTNESLEQVTVKILNETTMEWDEKEMYATEEFTGIDPYNVYLSGPKALIMLENPNAKTEKELVIFRDSFTSSLAPLLTSEYAKITLVDLRYIASPILKEFIEWKEGQDVLILYNVEVLNNGSILKII